MIKLENVMLGTEIRYLLNHYSMVNFFRGRKCITYQDLENLIMNDPILRNSQIEEAYDKAIKRLKKNNQLGKEPIIYETRGYEDSRLLYTDSVTLGKALILSNVTNEYPVSYIELNSLSIEKIKMYLSHCTLSGENFLQKNFRKIGKGNLQSVLMGLDMYEQQVIRQAELTEDKTVDVFSLDKDRKQKMVEDIYADIVSYLVANTSEKLVWGNLSDKQKSKLISSAINSRKEDILIKNNLVNVVSNYTTVPELESIGKGDCKVLKRFIIK